MYKASFGLPIKKKKKHTSSFRQSSTGRGRYRVITVLLSRYKIHDSRFTFAVHGSGFRVQGSGFSVQRSRYTIHDYGIAKPIVAVGVARNSFYAKQKGAKVCKAERKERNNRNAMKIVQSRETFVRTSLYARAESELKPFENRVSRHLRTNLTS